MQRILLLIDISSDSNYLYSLIHKGLHEISSGKSECLGSVPLPTEWSDVETIHDYCLMAAFEEVFLATVLHNHIEADVLRVFYDQYVKNSAVSICYRVMETYKLHHLKNQRHIKLLVTPTELIISYMPHL